MMAELLAKDSGYCRGRGGSMHIADVATGNLGANGIVGGGIPIAVGAALAQQLTGSGKVVVSFFGDGAANEGAFHEAVEPGRGVGRCRWCSSARTTTTACRWRPTRRSRSRTSPTRARGVRHPRRHRRRQRRAGGLRRWSPRPSSGPAPGRGPTLVENVTYRWKGHSKSDKNLYRTREEIAAWQERDPIARFEEAVRKAGLAHRRRDHGGRARRPRTRSARPSAPPTRAGPPRPTATCCSTPSTPTDDRADANAEVPA